MWHTGGQSAMPLFAWMLLLAAASSVEVVEQTYQIPANGWSYFPLELRPRSALVKADFTVEAGPPVQLLLMEQADLERLNSGETHGMVQSTAVGTAGHLEVSVVKPGDYGLVVENRSGRAETSKVRLRVSSDFADAATLSPQRQLTVVAISFAVFFGIVTYSARRLWQAVKR
jgi:hypothetical protein